MEVVIVWDRDGIESLVASCDHVEVFDKLSLDSSGLIIKIQ